MLSNPVEFLQTHVEELEYLIGTEQWEDAELLCGYLSEFIHLFDAETLDMYYEWVDNIQNGLMYE